MFSIPQGPAKQTATDTINILCGRLQNATLLEDRRNAILGLRSFARQFPASVASGSLRDLIGSLRNDVQDIDTVKVVLETLLMLFSPDGTSPEASEEVTLWIADEFTQRQENITVLLDLLDAPEFHPRLYALQLLNAILSARAERTEECIFTAPLGISRLVAVLDDGRDAIRTEGLSLLTYLTPHSNELQKLVAFENAFDKIFLIIEKEGSLSGGDRIVEDCLILLANLLRMNVSNQSHFRETGCVPRLTLLLNDAVTEEAQGEEVADWVAAQRNRNIYALLAVLRLFLVRDGTGTQANQISFWQNGVLEKVLKLAFDHSTEVQIKSEALITCGDIIRGNSSLQESFAQLQVSAVTPQEGKTVTDPDANKVYVIDGLLELTLETSSLQLFDARMSACECIKAYFYKHPAIRLHFLRRAIDGHTSGGDETANILTTLLQPITLSSDPYRYWFASVIFYHLIGDDGDAKGAAMAVTVGDAANGEEVVTCIQTITANLIDGLRKDDDQRILLGYLMVLCEWLFEDPDAVNDFLNEGSNVQSLVQLLALADREKVMVQGLCTMLLGIVYEFSTKDSPVPRKTVHQILMSGMGRDVYVERLDRLRKYPVIRDFEVLPQRVGSYGLGGLPEVYFDKTFVDFMKDNFSRFQRAIDRDPGFEIPVVSNGIQKGISRELVDSLRSSLEEKEAALGESQEKLISIQRQLEQERSDHKRSKERSIQELSRAESAIRSMQEKHEDDIRALRQEHDRVKADLGHEMEHVKKGYEDEIERTKSRADADLSDLRRQLDHVKKSSANDIERTKRKADAEQAELRLLNSSLEAKLTSNSTEYNENTSKLKAEFETQIEVLQRRLSVAERKSTDAESALTPAREKIAELESNLEDERNQKAAVQGELDDLLMVFEDVEDKVSRYKKKLRDLGEVVSDGEDGVEREGSDSEAEDDGK